MALNGLKWSKMFRGTSFHTIDTKGRIKIPSRFREMINLSEAEGVMVSRMDGCLVAYTFEEWEKVETKILSLAEKSEYMRSFRRFFVGGAFECVSDKQDRILIPPLLRRYSNIEKDIVLVGVLDHFEVWSMQKWETVDKAMENEIQKEEFRNEIAKLGL